MKFVKQLLIILSISFIAEIMEYFIPLPVAASIYGLILMLIGLVTGLIPLKEVEDAADFLVEIMPIMFIPATVGIMTSIEALKQMLVPLCVISIVSTVLVFGVTGRVTQGIIRKSGKFTAQKVQDMETSEESVNGVKDTAQAASDKKGEALITRGVQEGMKEDVK